MKKLFITGLIFAAVGFAQTEKTAKIGSQEWTTVNLDVHAFRNGDVVPEAKSAQEWVEAGKQKKPAWCYYNHDPASGRIYGKLYNWYAVNDSRGLAAKGWHIASASEWQTLIDYYSGLELAGGKLKQKGTRFWKSPNTGAEDTDGFAALPGGLCDQSGRFFTINNYAVFWTATETSRASAVARHLSHAETKIYQDGMDKAFGFSVRCVKD